MASTIEVILRSVDAMDDFHERKIIMSPYQTIPVGRSSKNTTKNLTASPNNAFINSPVISREHATLSASATDKNSDSPLVFVTDNGSMHGTYVNGQRLAKGVQSKLNNGDTIRFGDNVVRDSDSFIAKMYRVTARFVDPPKTGRSFPRGISVPDVVSSDDEDTPSNGPAPSSPHSKNYGSEANPFTIDDFDPAFEYKSNVTKEVDNKYPSSPPQIQSYEGDHEVPTSLSLYADDIDADEAHIDSSRENSSDEEEEEHDYPDEASEQSMSTSEDEFDSNDEDGEHDVDTHFDDYDNESRSGSDASDSDNAEKENADADVTRRLKLGAMLNHEQQKMEIPPVPVTVPTHTGSTATQTPLVNLPTAANPRLPQLSQFFNSGSGASFLTRPVMNDTEQDRFRSFENDMFATWDPMQFPSAPWPHEQSASMFPSNNYGRESVPTFDRPHAYVPSPFPETHMPINAAAHPAEASSSRTTDSDLVGSCLQRAVTPPVRRLFDAPLTSRNSVQSTCDEPNTPVQPTSRTGVSIADIVEVSNAPQQPPTPTSVSSPPTLKRKAEVLDEDSSSPSDLAGQGQLPASAEVESPPESLTQAPRKKAKARRSLRPVAYGMTGFLIGGATVISALLLTPERVFEQLLS